MPTYAYSCEQCGEIEIFHSIMDDPHKICPECGKDGLERIISTGGAFIVKGRAPNQYGDCIGVKNWRDKNGNLHPVTAADGSSKSPTTTSRQYNSPEKIKAIKKRDEALRKKQRADGSIFRKK